MTDQFGPRKRICLLNASAQYNRMWVSQSGDLHFAHFQTLGQEEPILKEGDAAVGVGRSEINDSAAYEQCVRGCLGPIVGMSHRASKEKKRSLDEGVSSAWREASILLREFCKGLRVMNNQSSPSSAHDALLFPLREGAAD